MPADLLPLLAAMSAAIDRLDVHLQRQVLAEVARFDGWYDSAEITNLATTLAQQVGAVQRQTAAATDAYLARVATEIVGRKVHPTGIIDVTDLRTGARLDSVYGRLADEYRYQASQGKSADEARQVVAQRADAMVQTDSQLAMRAQARKFMVVHHVDGYRRIIHPELSRHGTCGMCVAASDRIYYRQELLPIHARCVPGNTRIAAEAVSAITRRHDPKPLVVLTTASGQELRITANHPVLTDEGWIPAHLVNVGGHVVRHRDGHRVVGSRPKKDDRPATVEQLWRAATVDHRLHPRAVPLAAKDFHGDGMNGEVDVVATDGLLAHVGDVSFAKPSGKSLLVAGHAAWVGLPSERGFHEALFWLRDSTSRLVRRSGETAAFVAGQLLQADRRGGAAATDVQALLSESSLDDWPGYTEILRESLDGLASLVAHHDLPAGDDESLPTRFDPAFAEFSAEGRDTYAQLGRDLRRRLAGDVELDRVVDKRWVEGPHVVYNLHTAEGWYVADSVIVSNCKCTVLPIINGQDPGQSINKADLDRLYAAGGGTDAAKLKRVRVQERHHGELGPVLTRRGQHWRGPAEVSAA